MDNRDAPTSVVDGGLRNDDFYVEMTLSMRPSTWRAIMQAIPQGPERRALFAAFEVAYASTKASLEALDKHIADLKTAIADLQSELPPEANGG